MSRIGNDCRPTDWLGNLRVVAADACVDSSAMDDNVWEVLEQACDLTPFTRNSSEGRWYISSQIFKDRGQFCVSQALCKLDTWANYADEHFVIDALGGDYDVDVSDQDNPTTLGQIVGKLKECGFESIDPEMLRYVGAINFFSGFDAARIKKIVVGLQNTANMCVVDEADYFLGEVFKSGAADNRFAKLALVNARLNEAIAQNKPLAADVLPTLLEVFNNPEKCDATNLAALIVPSPIGSAVDALTNYVVNKAIRAAKIQPQQEAPPPPPPPVECGKKAHVDPDNNQHCLCDDGYVSKNDDTGDCKPKRTGGGGGGKKPAAGGKKYNPFEE